MGRGIESTDVTIQSSPPATDSAPTPEITTDQLQVEENVSLRAPRTKFRLGAIITALYLALSIAALDHTILATAIPTITSQLRSASGYFWIGSAYLLAVSASGPIWAKFSDIFGRKPAILGAVTLFGGASIIAALSRTVEMLIAARALQGTAAGGLFQMVNIVISDIFSMRQRTFYLGLANVVWGLAGGTGPLIGGAFTQYVSWRWCFWINLPICAISLVLLVLFLDVHNPRTPIVSGLAAFDWLGTLAIISIVVMLLLGLNFGGVFFPWSSATVICLIIFGVIMIGVFIFTEKKWARYPLIPFSIFRNGGTVAAFMVCFFHGMVFIAVSYYLPLYFQSVKQASPLRSGVLILPNVVPEACMGIVNGVIMLKTGHYREIIWVGLALLTLGTGLYIQFTPDTPIAVIVGMLIIGGTGSGCLFEAPLVAVQAMASQDDTATATAAFGFTRNLATAMSLVLGGVIFQNGMEKRAGDLERAGLSSSLLEAFSAGKAAANVDLIGGIADPVQRAEVERAFAWSLHNMWIMYCGVAGVGFLASLFIKHNVLSTEHTETKTGLKEKREMVN